MLRYLILLATNEKTRYRKAYSREKGEIEGRTKADRK